MTTPSSILRCRTEHGSNPALSSNYAARGDMGRESQSDLATGRKTSRLSFRHKFNGKAAAAAAAAASHYCCCCCRRRVWSSSRPHVCARTSPHARFSCIRFSGAAALACVTRAANAPVRSRFCSITSHSFTLLLCSRARTCARTRARARACIATAVDFRLEFGDSRNFAVTGGVCSTSTPITCHERGARPLRSALMHCC